MASTNGYSTQTEPSTYSAININLDKYYTVSLNWNAEQQIAEMYVNGVKILQSSTSSYSEVTRIDLGIISTYRVQNPLNVYGDNFSITTI